MARGVEIELKFLLREVPFELSGYEKKEIEQYYLSTDPVLRLRRSNERYILTIKGKGLLEREEHELPYNKADFERLKSAALGIVIEKTRYLIPYEKYTIELDVFKGAYEGLVLAEIEFESKEEADRFEAPSWLGEDVTLSGGYQNSKLAEGKGAVAPLV